MWGERLRIAISPGTAHGNVIDNRRAKIFSFRSVTDSDRVRQQRQSSAPIKVVLDQDQLKRSFVGLWTPAGSDHLDSRRI